MGSWASSDWWASSAARPSRAVPLSIRVTASTTSWARTGTGGGTTTSIITTQDRRRDRPPEGPWTQIRRRAPRGAPSGPAGVLRGALLAVQRRHVELGEL